MLEDRDYMKPEFSEHRWQAPFRLRWTWTMILVAAYVAVLVAEQITTTFFQDKAFIFSYFELSRTGIEHGYVWQFVTYQFMHAGWLHLILNSWAILIFGNELEQALGARRYLTLVFSSGIVGGVFQVLVAMAWPWFDGPVVGASACAFGLVAAFATLYPEQELTMLLFFVIPIRLRAKTLLLGSIVIALVGIVFPWDNVANAAHLGGMAMGWFYIKKILKGGIFLGIAGEPAYRQAQPAESAEKPDDGAESADVDAVLDKISARGINSLTSRERAILEAARKKMARR
jgi:membrane associated rhomboid family serine protease